jgi:HEAT repeat protein
MTQLNLEGARRHIEGILQAGSDGETTLHVLRKATEALAQIGTVESIFVLKRFLDSPHGGQLRLTVRKAIKDIRERHGIQEVEAGSFRVWE